MWAVSQPKSFHYLSYNEAYGMAASSIKEYAWYPYASTMGRDGYWKSHNNIARDHFEFQCGEVDMLLDVDQGILKFCVVGQLKDELEAIMHDLPRDTNTGWVPHFNTFCEGTKLRIARIPIELYGQPNNDLW